MEWVAIDVHIAGDAVTHRLADRFRLRVAEAAGLLALTFAGMVQHARDGSLADITDSQLEAWATWHGKKGQFAAFFREQLCDDTGTVRAWEEYNGRSIRRAEAAKERSRVWREQQDKERTERTQNANRMHTQTHTVCRTRPDQTVPKDVTAKNNGADAPPSGRSRSAIHPDAERVLAHHLAMHPLQRPERSAALKLISRRMATYTADELMAASDGNASDAWAIESGNQGVDYVFKGNASVDKWRARAVPRTPVIAVVPKSRGRVLLDLCRRYDLFAYNGNTDEYEAKLVRAADDPQAGPDFRDECRAFKPWKDLPGDNDHFKAQEIEKRLATRATARAS